MAVQVNRLYVVGVSGHGLMIFGLGDPLHPDSLGTLPLETGDESKLHVRGDYAYGVSLHPSQVIA